MAREPIPPLYGNLGDLSYPVTTRSPEAQRYFDQGLRLAYAFNHAEAARAFRRAQAIDPTCAMCYWSEAYALGGDLAGAEAALREAAAVQATLPYMEPPFWYYPVRQTLAAVLLEAGQPARAMREFQASLHEAPNNAFALYGLMLAQEAAGDAAGAKATKALFERAWAGETELPQLARL